MTTSPTQPDLRRLIFKPGDRVTGTGAPWPRPGTVQPYPTDPVTIEVLFDGEAEPVTFYVEELHLLTLVEPAPDAHGTPGHNGTPGNCEACHAETFGHVVINPIGPSPCDLCGIQGHVEAICPTTGSVTPEPDPAGPDYASSAYRAVVNLAYLTELLDGRHDVSLYVGWDGYRGRETTLHLAPDAALEDAAALAARIGLCDYKAKPYEGDVHHRWTGERHGQRVEVVWVARDAAPVETPAAGE